MAYLKNMRICPAIRAVAAAALLAAVAFSQGRAPEPNAAARSTTQEPEAGSPGQSESRADIFTTALGDVERKLFFTGELQAEKSTDISVPRIRSGFSSMVTFLAPEGEPVRKGQLILEFDSSALLSQKSESERRLDEAKLKIDKTKADLEVQRSDLLNSLAQAEGNLAVAELYGKIEKDLLPANTHQKYQVDLEKAKLAVQKVREQIQNFEASYDGQVALADIDRAQAELDLKKIEGDLALLRVHAPQDGILIYGDNWANNRKIQVGDVLFPGMPVVQLPDMSSLQVAGYVYDTELSYLKRGMRCNFGLDAVPGAHTDGTIVSLTSVAGRKGFASQHKVFRALIQPDRVDLAVMKPGMTVHVEIPITLASNVLAVPREFVGLGERGRYYVIKGTDARTAVRQNVELGAAGDRMVEVTSGLSAGEPLMHPARAAEVGR